ncbi:MAG: IS200/IS605 family transposase [Balneolaceae bacterium]|nr:IS200/IS605 family transposase [Balneolaceae bacterium]
MPKTYNSVWIHLIFSTKNREELLTKSIRNQLCEFLRNESVLKGYHLDSINGYQNHIHILYKQTLSRPISESAKWFKGRSSKWINETFELSSDFRWQQGYGVFSVSRENLEKVRNYIYHQEKIHKSRSFSDEFKMFMKEDEVELNRFI